MRSNIHNARQHVTALRAALLTPSPEELEAYLPALDDAVRDLHELQESPDFQNRNWHASDIATMRQDLLALSSELKIAGTLIEHGAAFQMAWARMLATAVSGYRPDGESAPLEAPGTVSIQG